MTFPIRQTYLDQRGPSIGHRLAHPRDRLNAVEWALFYTAQDALVAGGCRPEAVGTLVNRMVRGEVATLNGVRPLVRAMRRLEPVARRIRGEEDDRPAASGRERDELDALVADAFGGLAADGLLEVTYADGSFLKPIE